MTAQTAGYCNHKWEQREGQKRLVCRCGATLLWSSVIHGKPSTGDAA